MRPNLPLARSSHSTIHPPTCKTPHPQPNPQSVTPLKRRVLATDLDGTLLTTSKSIHPTNASAVLQALQKGLIFIPATGKSRSGAFHAMAHLGHHLKQLGLMQGVFLNGLLVSSNDTVIIHEAFLNHIAVTTVIRYAKENGLTPLFYRRDSVFVERRNSLTDIFIVSHEPVPTEIGNFRNLGRVNKALLLHPTRPVKQFRRELETVLRGKAVITQAREDVLEVMPEGVNKATGLELLLTELGFVSEDVVAVGDNENDVDMIRMAGLGIAVGNAVPRLVSVADELVAHCDDAAIAEVLRKYVL